MRITVRLADRLWAQAKNLAAKTGQTLSTVPEDALREVLARRSTRVNRKPVRLRTVLGDGVRPGVDLHDSAALLDLMES